MKKLINSKLGQWKLGVIGRGAWRSPRWSDAVPESRGRRELGSPGLRRRKLGDFNLKIELGGSRLRRKLLVRASFLPKYLIKNLLLHTGRQINSSVMSHTICRQINHNYVCE